MGTVAEFTRKGLGTQPHACDTKGLSPKEFLLAVMDDPTQPISIRIKAAKAAAPYFTPEPRPFTISCKIIIPPFEGAAEVVGESQSNSDFASYNPQPQSEAVARLYTENHSSPLTFNDLQLVKTQVQDLLPDADLSNFHDRLIMCECGRWAHFGGKVGSSSRH